MRVVKLFLPGRFEDCYVYMGWVMILTENRTLRLYNLEQIVDSLESQFSGSLPISTLLFSQNDWLESPPFKLLVKNKEFAQSFLSALEKFPQPFVELDEKALRSKEHDLDIPAHVLLDMLIYNKRLYVGADTGFYHIDMGWNHTVTLQGSTKKRLDARCVNTSARYGAVNASCGDEGLFTAFDDFGWSGTEQPSDMRKLNGRSLRTSWFTYDLVNYPTYDTPLLLRGEKAIAKIENREVLIQIGAERLDLFDVIHDKYGIQRESIRYTCNSDKELFINTVEGYLYALGIQRSKPGELQIRSTKTFESGSMRILSANMSKPGLIVETEDRILLFVNGEWLPLIESEALSVRTFIRSIRFQNIVAITNEEGVWLASLFDDSDLLLTRG